jgi:anti-anti-sigma factor
MSDPEPFSCPVAVEEPGRVVVVTPIGRIGPQESEVFRESVDAAYRAGGRRFVFDLGRLTYVGSTGLRVLAALASRVKADGVVCVCDPTPNVQSVLDVTKLAQLLHVYPTRSEALDAARTR